MARYGKALAQTLADSNAGLLLHTQRIELAVIANMVSRYPEVAGVVFYSASNEIIALNGSTEHGNHYTASATLDDTITGYVSVVLSSTAFAQPFRWVSWLLTLGALALSPFLSLGLLQLSASGNRSLPIVSVPEPKARRPQPSFALTINLHNQMALSRDQRISAVEDAMTMAQEVCAIHQGMAIPIAERGVILLFDPKNIPPAQAVCASFLLQHMLAEFETDGRFRCYLDVIECPGSPADMEQLSADALAETADLDNMLTLAALARAPIVLISEAVYTKLAEIEKTWAAVFEHPLLEDLGNAIKVYSINALPTDQAQLVDSQATLILGFNS